MTNPNQQRVMRTIYQFALASFLACGAAPARGEGIEMQRDDDAGALRIVIDGREALVYQYGEKWAIPHFYPVRSPSGKLLTTQTPDPYPHHRSLWVADRVQLEGGPNVDFYHCWKNYREAGKPESGFKHFIRHDALNAAAKDDDHVAFEAKLRWIVDGETPVLDDVRHVTVKRFGEGEYLIDLSWKLTASYGDVQVLSDSVHYACPYVRIAPHFSGEKGGAITDDHGRAGQKATNGQYALWIDYSNTIEGAAEGLAVFTPDDGERRKWLTREYGTFGPRRPDALSGTKFTLKKGESLTGRAGILVHRGDVTGGKVAERYRAWADAVKREGQPSPAAP